VVKEKTTWEDEWNKDAVKEEGNGMKTFERGNSKLKMFSCWERGKVDM
jgi:hypothetical protein